MTNTNFPPGADQHPELKAGETFFGNLQRAAAGYIDNNNSTKFTGIRVGTTAYYDRKPGKGGRPVFYNPELVDKKGVEVAVAEARDIIGSQGKTY